MLGPDCPRPALEDDGARAARLLRTFRRGPDGPGQEGRQVGPVQGIRIHTVRKLRVANESPGSKAHD